jgi:hypothetical protein
MIGRDLSFAREIELGEVTGSEARRCKLRRKDGTGTVYNCAEKTMGLLGRKITRLVLVRGRSRAVTNNEAAAVRVRQREHGMTERKRAQEELEYERAACSGGNRSPQKLCMPIYPEH